MTYHDQRRMNAMVLFVFGVFVLTAVLAGAPEPASCPYTSESTSGLNRTCTYACPKGATSITIGAAQLCPVSIDVK